MTDAWKLPEKAEIGGKSYRIHGDFRDILEIFGYLQNPELPLFIRWRIALALFYEEPVPEDDRREAAAYLCDFIRCGQEDKPGPRLMDWQQDAQEIIADVNRAAGREIRSLPFLHWWTFLSLFRGIGEGQLSQLVSIRCKLRKGQKLDSWEREFYRENREKVDLKPICSRLEQAEKQRLLQMLDKKEGR